MKSRCLSPSSGRPGWRSLPVLAGLGALLLAGPLGCAARTGVDPVADARPAAAAAEPAAPATPMMRMPPPPPPVVVSEAAPGNGGHGVLIMAHGGGEVWNETVIEAAAGARHEGPVVVAFGMAHPVSMQRGVDTLDELGAERVSVVRLFVSGESFRTDTRYLLGLSEEEPELPWVKAPLEHDLTIATHEHGLMGSPEVSQILLTRALALSEDPAGESVLLVAHGMGDEGENDRVLDSMRLAAGRIAEMDFARGRGRRPARGLGGGAGHRRGRDPFLRREPVRRGPPGAGAALPAVGIRALRQGAGRARLRGRRRAAPARRDLALDRTDGRRGRVRERLAAPRLRPFHRRAPVARLGPAAPPNSSP